MNTLQDCLVTKSWTVLVCVALAGVLCSVANAVEAPSIDFLAAALRSQEQAAGKSLQVEYKLVVTKEGEDPATKQPQMTTRYVRTPGRVFIEDKYAGGDTLLRYSFNRITKEERKASVRRSDGSTVNGAIGRGAAMPRMTTADTVDTVGFYLVTMSLAEAVKYGSVSPERQPIDGHDCWKVDIPGSKIGLPEGLGFLVWLDPHIAYNPRRVERYSTETQGLGMTFEYTDYREVGNGVWFPMRKIVTTEGSPEKGTSFVQAVSVGQDVSPESVTVSFPPGTRVEDLDDYSQGRWFTVR